MQRFGQKPTNKRLVTDRSPPASLLPHWPYDLYLLTAALNSNSPRTTLGNRASLPFAHDRRRLSYDDSTSAARRGKLRPASMQPIDSVAAGC